jgi:hypothetical protein
VGVRFGLSSLLKRARAFRVLAHAAYPHEHYITDGRTPGGRGFRLFTGIEPNVARMHRAFATALAAREKGTNEAT